MSEKYRVHELVRFHYSDIGEYVDEHHTDRPLRNDILVDVLNEQDKSINELKSSNHSRTKIIIRLTDKINQLEKENEQLKFKLESAEKVLHNLGVKLVYSETYGKWLVE